MPTALRMTLTNSTSLKHIVRRGLHVITASLLGLSGCFPAQAQEHAKTQTNLENNILDLTNVVQSLAREQHEIVDQLDELKRRLPPQAPALLAPQVPATISVKGEYFNGQVSAPAAIIEYSDFECPFCAGYERETSPQIFDTYVKTGKVRLFHKDLPLAMHPHAMQAARAARCAGEQGKYWEMHDSLFANQSTLTDKGISDRAPTLGMDEKKFSECLASGKYTDEIRKSAAEAQKLGVHGTPTFFLGVVDAGGDVVKISKTIVGAHPYADFQSALDELLASKTDAALAH